MPDLTICAVPHLGCSGSLLLYEMVSGMAIDYLKSFLPPAGSVSRLSLGKLIIL